MAGSKNRKHRKKHPGVSRVIPIGPGIAAILDAQRRQFVEQFGREPGPDDPIFFDPDFHVPVEGSDVRLAEVFAKASLAAGVTKTKEEAFSLGLDFLEGRIRVSPETRAELDAWAAEALGHRSQYPEQNARKSNGDPKL
jgi:hypothetical protein